MEEVEVTEDSQEVEEVLISTRQAMEDRKTL
jgi:hypothetical protein